LYDAPQLCSIADFSNGKEIREALSDHFPVLDAQSVEKVEQRDSLYEAEDLIELIFPELGNGNLLFCVHQIIGAD